MSYYAIMESQIPRVFHRERVAARAVRDSTLCVENDWRTGRESSRFPLRRDGLSDQSMYFDSVRLQIQFDYINETIYMRACKCLHDMYIVQTFARLYVRTICTTMRQFTGDRLSFTIPPLISRRVGKFVALHGASKFQHAPIFQSRPV